MRLGELWSRVHMSRYDHRYISICRYDSVPTIGLLQYAGRQATGQRVVKQHLTQYLLTYSLTYLLTCLLACLLAYLVEGMGEINIFSDGKLEANLSQDQL